MDVGSSSGSSGTDTGAASTPASTPAAPPAAAPPSTDSSSQQPPAAVERPTSFRDAMARVGEATPPDPESAPVVGDQPPDATVQAPTPETPPDTAVSAPEAKGPIPFERHEAILKNARAKTEQEVVSRFREQYGPHVELGQKFQADPVGTAIQVINELAETPEYGQAVLSGLARTLGARRGRAQAEADDVMPPADLVSQDGQFRVYSEEQQAKRDAWLQRQWMKTLDERLTPLQQREAQAQQRERLDAAKKDAYDRMGKVLQPFKALPEFQENQQAIAAKTKTYMDEGHEPQVALGLAVASILRDVVLPSRTAQSRNELVAQAVAKSTGSTTVPGQAPAAPAKRPTSMAEGFASIKF